MWILLAGCSSTCVGPQCEDSWPAARLVIASGDGLPADEGVLAQSLRIEGSLADGADWTVLPYGEGFLIGMPDRSAVAYVRAPTTIESMVDVQIRLWERPLNEAFGTSLALADTDGDGVDELWVGAPHYEGRSGAVYRFSDLDDPTPDSWDRRLTGATPSDELGRTILACGDLDGDEADELLLGAPRFNRPGPEANWIGPGGSEDVQTLAGAVFLLRSTLNDSTAQYPWELGPSWWGASRGAGAGRALLCGTDFTEDRRDDIAIGMPLEDDEAGRVHLLTAFSPSGPLNDGGQDILRPTELNSGWFGGSLARLGGREPGFVIGSPGFDNGRGRLTVFRQLGIFSEPEATFTNPRDQPDHFATTVASGDVDGDGLADLIVGAPDWREVRQNNNLTRFDSGRLWVWPGELRVRWDIADANLDPQHVIRGTHAFQRVGASVTVVDLDGDGRDDLALPLRAADPAER